jgi:hypothetical protein
MSRLSISAWQEINGLFAYDVCDAVSPWHFIKTDYPQGSAADSRQCHLFRKAWRRKLCVISKERRMSKYERIEERPVRLTKRRF